MFSESVEFIGFLIVTGLICTLNIFVLSVSFESALSIPLSLLDKRAAIGIQWYWICGSVDVILTQFLSLGDT